MFSIDDFWDSMFWKKLSLKKWYLSTNTCIPSNSTDNKKCESL